MWRGTWGGRGCRRQVDALWVIGIISTKAVGGDAGHVDDACRCADGLVKVVREAVDLRDARAGRMVGGTDLHGILERATHSNDGAVELLVLQRCHVEAGRVCIGGRRTWSRRRGWGRARRGSRGQTGALVEAVVGIVG